MAPSTKKIRVFPYKIENPLSETLTSLMNKFKFENLVANQILYGDNVLILVVDRLLADKYLCCRLLKLRRFIPSVVNLKKANERLIELLPEEDIKETSHFIWDFDSGYILGEYNYEGTRHLATPLQIYMNSVFELLKKRDEGEEVELFDIYPVRNTNTIQIMKRENNFKGFFMKVSDSDMARFEKENSCDVIGLLSKFSKDKSGYIEIRIIPRRGKSLDKKSVVEKALVFKGMGILKSLVIEGEESKYDILNNNLLFFNIDITYDSEKKTVDSTTFYELAKDCYEHNKERFT